MYRREPVISSSAESLLSEKGWRIGRTHGGSAVRLIPDLLSTHAAIMGKTGSGKSNILRLIISSISQSSDGSIILLDPHGDLATDVAKSFPESAIMIPAKSIFIEEDERSITMNPLQGASENPEFYTGWIRDTFASNGVFSQGTWGPRLEVVFFGNSRRTYSNQERRHSPGFTGSSPGPEQDKEIHGTGRIP